MATMTVTADWTAADLIDYFGPIRLRRIRLDPAPGTATEEDVVEIYAKEKRLYELIDGVLLEKTAGVQESYHAMRIGRLIGNFVENGGLGIVLGADGMARLFPDRIRIPDVSFIAWERFPGRKVPSEAFVNVGLDLAIEILSPSNTVKEMDLKLRDYFQSGIRLVWYVAPDSRTVRVFTSLDQSVLLRKGESLDGGEVLPGFTLALDRLFSDLRT